MMTNTQKKVFLWAQQIDYNVQDITGGKNNKINGKKNKT